MENDNSKLEKRNDEIQNVIMLGPIGSGKSFLLHNFSGFKYKISSKSGYSENSDAAFIKCKNDEINFILLPSLNKFKDINKSLDLQKRILKTYRYKAICIVIKYRDRIDLILRESDQIFNVIKNHINNAIVIITNTESIEEEEVIDIGKEFKKYYGISNILYSNKDSNVDNLLDHIKDFMSKMECITEENNKIDINSLNNQIEISCDILHSHIHEKYTKDIFSKANEISNYLRKNMPNSLIIEKCNSFIDYSNRNLIEFEKEISLLLNNEQTKQQVILFELSIEKTIKQIEETKLKMQKSKECQSNKNEFDHPISKIDESRSYKKNSSKKRSELNDKSNQTNNNLCGKLFSIFCCCFSDRSR